MFTKKAQGSLRNFCRLLTANCRLLLRPRNHSKNNTASPERKKSDPNYCYENTAPPERKKSDPQLLLRKYRSAGAGKIRPAIIATKIPLRRSG
jgi:hypothetical protein